MASEPLIVQAVYSFKRTNNDELCFKKGDIITITQKEDGGWWEGTLGGKTGWFPSNYVVECKDAPVLSPITPISQQKQYQEVVIKDLVDSEKAHVAELQGLITNFLVPLEKSSILTSDEFKQLTSNLSEVVETHQQLLSSLEENIKVIHGARIGNLFLTRAPKIKAVHQTYCSLHPRAVCILDKYKDELTKFMESCNAASPGVLVLTTGLSKPFRRLDKYSGMLQELERHLEESHPDRGDTQRSVVVYKEIAATCAATRRQKELELQVLTGPVRGWEGQSLATLGDIIYMGSVAMGPQHHDRYLVLFPTTLLMLSISHRLSAFIYEGKLPLTGIVVNRLEDSDQFKNAFEISGPMIEKKVAVCQSKDEANNWVELLRKHMPRSSSVHQKACPSQAEIIPQPHLNQRGYCSRTSVLCYTAPVNYAMTYPPPNYPPTSPYTALTKFYQKNVKQKMSPLMPTRGMFTSSRQGITPNESRLTPTPPSHGTLNNNKGWSASCLRPAPPLSPRLALGTIPNGSPLRINRKATVHKEDALILEVIEAYCSTGKNRSTVNSVTVSNNGQRTSEIERHVLEIVQILQAQIKNCECQLANISTQLREEQAARSALQNIVKDYVIANSKEVEKIEWPILESNIMI